MRLSPFPGVRARTLLVISICVTSLALISFEGRRQHAASIVVNSTSDVANGSDGLCTLREAIAAANTNVASGVSVGECVAGSGSGSDSIDATGITGTINLTGALTNIASSMSITGPGSSQLTVRRDTGGDYRIFTITSGPVAISGMTLTNGKTPDPAPVLGPGFSSENGGGILNSTTLTLTDMIITGNSTGMGGNGTQNGGSGGGGGGIASTANLTMANCSVTGNTAGNGGNNGGNGGPGGGIFISGFATLTMTNCTVTGNHAGNGNSFGISGRGGGIHSSSGGAITLTKVSISNNQSGSGGGGIGGGLDISASPIVTISDSTIDSNQAGGSGQNYAGGIYVGGAVTITGTTISNNAGVGGGMLTHSGTVKLINSTISGNSGPSGAGISNDGSSLFLTNCTVTGNTGSFALTAATNSFSPITLRNTIVAANDAGMADIQGSGPVNSLSFTSQGNNLIGNPGNVVAFTNGSNGDQVGTPGTPLNPQLGALLNNGGLTKTHALLSNSPALDSGSNCVTQPAHCGDSNIPQLLTDQRGASRMVDGPDVDTTATVDIGAYETQVALANLPDTSTNEDTQLLIAFDADTSTVTSATATSDNPTLVPNDSAHLSVAMNSSGGIVTINPATNLSGTANITVTVNRTGGPESKTFILTVNPANEVPSFTKGQDQTVNEDAGAQTVPNWATAISAGPADESGQALTFQVTGNTNAALFAAGPAISSTGTLTYTPAANASGSATVTINLKDDGGTANGGVDTSASQTFTITVSPVNDAPTFTKGADPAVNEDSGAQSVNWATAISRGPADESAQTLTFQVTGNSNAALFSARPAISSTGTLTYTPAANANGSAIITINLKDNGGTANGGVDTSTPQMFTITVNAVNDVPFFTRAATPAVNEDAGAQTVPNWAASISAGPANESGQVLTFQITGNTNAALFSAGPAVSSTGTLTYTPAADANGSATITLNLKDDGGTADGGVDTSASQTFTITVNSVNDAPSFTKGADQTVNNNAGAQSVPNWATAISAGPANESSQTLTFQITNNTGLFSAGPAISSTGTLTYTPAANMAGSSTITIRLQDNGGTASGGVNLSGSQTFTITVVAVGGSIGFSAANYNTTESSGFTTVTVNRTGNLTQAVTVDYRTSGNTIHPCSTPVGIADPKCDFTTAIGTLRFAAGEDTKTVNILISQDSFVEGPETFGISLLNPTNNAAIGAGSSITIADDVTEPPTNLIDDIRNFVRQHYHDFLSREPDPAGWDFWTNQITSCGSDVQCNEVRRIDVSASFFLSIEFQQSGYLVERFYKVGYGDATGPSTFGSNHQLPVPMVQYEEFIKDTQRIGQGVIVLQPGWEQALEANKQAYALEFVQTTRFSSFHQATLTPAQFVDRLNNNASGPLSLSERQTAINLFGGAANSSNLTARAQVMRMVADDADLFSAEYNRAFVLAQYFGYLRRNPIAAPDNDYTGYDFWLTKLNQFNGNYINAEMVKAFLSSIEYRQRFGP